MTTRPRAVTVLVALTATNAFRLVGWGYAAAALAGQVPRSGVFGGVGDGIAGAAAIAVAVALARRPGFGTWLAAVAWNVYALTDVLFANAITFFAPDAEPQAPAWTLVPLYFLVAHVVSLRLLTRPAVRAHFGVTTTPAPAAQPR